jgi:hypothetical protein
MITAESNYGCVEGSFSGGYACAADCNCTYPKDGDGVIIELPR